MELPRRELTIEVTLNAEVSDAEPAEPVVAVLSTLAPSETAALFNRNLAAAATNGASDDEVDVRLGADQMVEVFQSHLVELRGLTFDGEPYDRENPEHRKRVASDMPWAWQLHGGASLIGHATPSATTRGN